MGLERALLATAAILFGLCACGAEDDPIDRDAGTDGGVSFDGGGPPLNMGRIRGTLSVFTPGAASTTPTSTVPISPSRMASLYQDFRAKLGEASEAASTSSGRSGLKTVRSSSKLGSTSVEIFPPSDNPQPPVLTDPLPAEFVRGEAIVVFRDNLEESLSAISTETAFSPYRMSVGVYGGPKVATVRFRDRSQPSRVLSSDETKRLRAQLEQRDSFVRAELNYYRWAHAVPNDDTYRLQWHYPLINLPTAWDTTTGSASVVVAVIDDGLNPHPELSRAMGGYDMVSDPQIAGDGDGRDATPHQVPLSHGTSSVWHGTHVAGTVGATSDNNTGVAGVDWTARLLPVRVLGRVVPGRGQGTSIDIIAGINWAVGITVPGVPANTTPAQVLNLSLGGGPTIQSEQDAVNNAVGRGAVVVVAAGNANEDATGQSLAGYQNVIAVGATDLQGRRAPYSNFGSVVDVMAPGGDMSSGVDANGDGNPDGVLSTYLDQNGTATGLSFLEGTSMAAPHVAGLAALMKAVNSALTPAEIEQILKQTATASSQCSEGCGAGLVNAGAAVAAAQGGISLPPAVALSTERLNIGFEASSTLSVFNSGGGQLNWQAEIRDRPELTLSGSSNGTLGAGQAATLTINVNRGTLVDGEYEGILVVQGQGNLEARATITFRVGAPPPVLDIGEVIVGTVGFDEQDETIVGGAAIASRQSNGYIYQLDSEPGPWLIVALADRNGNEELDSGDYWGFYTGIDDPREITLSAGDIISNIDFGMVPFSIEGGGGTNDASLGQDCDGASVTCVSPYECFAATQQATSGICTRDCTADISCPGGLCISGFGGDGSVALCLADCTLNGCPRLVDQCLDVGQGAFACIPPEF